MWRVAEFVSLGLALMFILLLWGAPRLSHLSILAFICPPLLSLWTTTLTLVYLGSVVLSVILSCISSPKVRATQEWMMPRGSSLRRGILCLFCLAMTCTLRPPQALCLYFNTLLKTSFSALVPSPVSPASPQIHLISWNVQRMGDLERHVTPQAPPERLRCLVKTIRAMEGLQRPQPDQFHLFAFQEASNQGLKILERDLSLRCQFIPYHPTRRINPGGLGVCATINGPWQINYVRKINLEGGGRWRALFAEVSSQSQPQLIFNLINLHFLPPKIRTTSLKRAVRSPDQVADLLRTMNQTTEIQRTQARGLLKLIEGYQDPTLVMGDFNAPPHAGAHPLFNAQWVDVWRDAGVTDGTTRSFFNGLLSLRLDYIYARRDLFRALESRVGHLQASRCSDHLPVSARLVLTPPPFKSHKGEFP